MQTTVRRSNFISNKNEQLCNRVLVLKNLLFSVDMNHQPTWGLGSDEPLYENVSPERSAPKPEVTKISAPPKPEMAKISAPAKQGVALSSAPIKPEAPKTFAPSKPAEDRIDSVSDYYSLSKKTKQLFVKFVNINVVSCP
jgi:hypothetical protein